MILPPNLLALIASYLTWHELLSFRKVTRACRRVAEDWELWRNEGKRLWSMDLNAFGLARKSWKQLLQDGITASQSWLEISRYSDILTRSDLETLQRCFYTCFHFPEIPLPKLRREARCFDTVWQETLAYPEESPEPQGFQMDMRDPDVLSVMGLLDDCSHALFEQIATEFDILNLMRVRWNVEPILQERQPLTKTGNPLLFSSGSDATSVDISTPPLVFLLHRALLVNAQFQCDYHYRELQELCEGVALLSDYSRRVTRRQWAAYSASAKVLDDHYQRFNALITEMYEAKIRTGPSEERFSVMRMLVVEWRRRVFDPLESVLRENAVELLKAVREGCYERLLKCQNRKRFLCEDDHRTLTLMKVVQCFVDFSVSEVNVHFFSHSQLALPAPYALLHEAVITSSKNFLDSAQPDVNNGPEALEHDLRLIERVFLAATHRQVMSLYTEYELSLWLTHFRAKYFSPWKQVTSRLRDSLADQHLNSPFGCAIFELQPCLSAKEDTRAFIEYLLAEDAGNLLRINRYNELKQVSLEDRNPTLEDEELEYCCRRDGRTLAAAQKVSRWAALTSDLTDRDLLELRAAQYETMDL